MAQNLIRIKQIDQAELSGFISNSLNTGIPLFINITGNNVVYTTGNQTISGVKTFASRPTVNGTGVLLSGEAASLPNTVVYTTGSQNISGIKTFRNDIYFSSGIYHSNNKFILDNQNILLSGNDRTGTIGTSVLISAGLATQPGTIDLKGNIALNYGIRSGTLVSIYNTGSTYPFIRTSRNNKIIIGADLPFGLDPQEMVYVKGDVFASNLVYNTGDQLIQSDKFFEHITDSSRLLPLLIKASGNASVTEDGTSYPVSGYYAFNTNLNLYQQSEPAGPFYIFFCDENKCVSNKYSWRLTTSISGGRTLYDNYADSVQNYKDQVFPKTSWTPFFGANPINFEYADLYSFNYTDYGADLAFIKVKNNRTIDFLTDEGYKAASLSKSNLLLQKVSFGENVNLTSNSEIRFNNDQELAEEVISMGINGIDLTSLNINQKSNSYSFHNDNATVSNKFVHVFNEVNTTGYLNEVVNGQSFLIKNLSSGNIRIRPVDIYNSYYSGFTGWGNNDYKQISFNNQDNLDFDILKAYTKASYSLILLENGKITGLGYDSAGETFLGRKLTGVLDLALGYQHAIAKLNISGKISGWGHDFYYQSSKGNNLTGVLKVVAGDYHTLALLNNGKITGWGANNYGQVAITTGFNDRFGAFTGNWSSSPLFSLSNVIDISAGNNFSLALLSGNGYSGFVTGWGNNSYRQLASGLNLTGVTKISAGTNYALAILNKDQRVTGWGNNFYGQNLSGRNLTGVSSISAGQFHSLAIISKDQRVTGWGYNNDGQTLSGQNLTGAKQVSAGDFQSVAVYFPRESEKTLRGNETKPSSSKYLATEKIENDTKLILAPKQSVELLGVKNSSYTGWIVLNTSAGVI
jgi:hypothetical protein